MKNIFLILAFALAFTACKKEKSPTPTPPVVTAPPPVVGVGDTVYFSIAFECPNPNFFNYRYDTTNTRVLVNGQKISFASMSPIIDAPHMAYNPVTFTNGTADNGMEQFDNFWRGTSNKILLMESGDSLTFEVDSLIYIYGNMPHGGNINIGVGTNTSIQPPLASLSGHLMWTTDNNAVGGIPIGRFLGQGGTNSNGGGGGIQAWYLGTNYRYTWVKP